jgi:hypothetical protein
MEQEDETRMVVNVTQEMIDKPITPGKRHETCPVAQAISAVVNRELYCVMVGYMYYSIHQYGCHSPILLEKTSDEMRRFIEDYDDTGDVKPISFDLPIPQEVLK